ncbi:MAG: GNAT family N-acetyltransferase, partial [Lachnospiraceae bacterium]|nr:GNAT family N-acetyltransferase [Lachnospiraceae bacterium]
NDKFKGKGYGTKAEQLAIAYAFDELKMKKVNADVIHKNKRSQHVLEKVGFQFIYADEERKHYQISRK